MDNTQDREQRGPGGPGGHRGGPGGPGGPGGFGPVDPEKLATFFGVSADDLRSELGPGKNLVEVATAHGKTTANLRAFLIEQATARIDEQIASAGKTAVAV